MVFLTPADFHNNPPRTGVKRRTGTDEPKDFSRYSSMFVSARLDSSLAHEVFTPPAIYIQGCPLAPNNLNSSPSALTSSPPVDIFAHSYLPESHVNALYTRASVGLLPAHRHFTHIHHYSTNTFHNLHPNLRGASSQATCVGS